MGSVLGASVGTRAVCRLFAVSASFVLCVTSKIQKLGGPELSEEKRLETFGCVPRAGGLPAAPRAMWVVWAGVSPG